MTLIVFLANLVQAFLFFSFLLSTSIRPLKRPRFYFYSDLFHAFKGRSIIRRPHISSFPPMHPVPPMNGSLHTHTHSILFAQKKCRTYENIASSFTRKDGLTACDLLSLLPFLWPFDCVEYILLYYLVADFKLTHGPRLKLTGNINLSPHFALHLLPSLSGGDGCGERGERPVLADRP